MSDFYIGYLPKPPQEHARFLRRVIPALAALVLVIAGVLLAGQRPFADAAFEFATVRLFEGVIAARPYPALRVSRPGVTDPESAVSEYLLVAPGKHGADKLAAPFDGQRVRLAGQLIYRGGTTMVEIVPGSLLALYESTLPTPAAPEPEAVMGPVTLKGEIVDSKCYFGVMNPGSGKVHRDCAARCLSGGIPPAFVTGEGERYLMVGPDGEPLPQDALREFIAEPITLTGIVEMRRATRLLRIDAAGLEHPAGSNLPGR